MTDLKLENNEGILLQTTDVGRYDGNDELEVYELYLTNKHLISIYEKSNGIFSKSETIVDKIPLTSICVANGVVQVEQVDDDDYGKALQLIYTNGKRELFELNVSPKKQYPVWKAAITDAVLRATNGETATSPPVVEASIVAEKSDEPTVAQETKVEKAAVGAGAFFAGFKSIVDTAKEAVSDVKQKFANTDSAPSEAGDESIQQKHTPKEESIMEEKKSIFCSNCGEKLVVGSKFCNSCGTPTNNMEQKKEEPTVSESKPEYKEEPITERKTVYEGNIHKCPNCGEVLNAFTANCPTCGHELRGTKAASAVRELATKLEAIEAKRETVKHNPLKNLYFGQSLTKTDEQKISLIRSFSIPNTKEDLYEFLILSESNIDIDLYDDDGNQFKKNDARRAVSDAWKAKFEQAYQKAKIIFAGDSRFNEIQALYDATHKSINKAKWKTWKLVGILWGVVLAVLAIIFTLVFTLTSNAEKKEIAQLEGIEEKIEIALEDGDYKLALMNADSLDFNGSDAGLEKDWEIKREYWIDKVIEEAAENGVTLERPADKTDNNDTSANAEDNVPDDKDATDSSTENEPITSNGTATFSEDSIVKDLKVTEYHLDDDGFLYTILVIENPSDYNLSITANVKFYNKDGKLIGAEDRETDAVEKKTHTIMYFMPDEEYDRIEYEFSVSEEDFYDCVVASLSYESVSAQDKEIISVTNNGKIPGEFVEAYALFFKDGKIVGFDSTYITDEDNLIKPGKTITEELDCYTEYDTVKFYFTGHGEW